MKNRARCLSSAYTSPLSKDPFFSDSVGMAEVEPSSVGAGFWDGSTTVAVLPWRRLQRQVGESDIKLETVSVL